MRDNPSIASIYCIRFLITAINLPNCWKIFLPKFDVSIPRLLKAGLKTHHVYSTLKRRGKGRFHVASKWNARGVFIGRGVARTPSKRYLSIVAKLST